MLNSICDGELTIGELLLKCAVLENEKRVFSERAMVKALGGTRSGERWKTGADGSPCMPGYLSAKNLIPFIDEDLKRELVNPIQYRVRGLKAYGIEVTILPRICEVFLKARDAKALYASQTRIAEQADILVRAFAKVGVVALIDEATGYDKIRGRRELERLLGQYLSDERLKWAKMFPDEFYQHIYRLKKWPWPPKPGANHPSIVGQITNDIVYERLPKVVLEKLQKVNPIDDQKHRRMWKHHQFLTEDLGRPSLRVHLTQVITVMRISGNWNQFMANIDRGFPKGGCIQLTFEDVV